jgi:hypothetical protein
LDTTALYTQVATNVIRAIMSPLDRLLKCPLPTAVPPYLGGDAKVAGAYCNEAG